MEIAGRPVKTRTIGVFSSKKTAKKSLTKGGGFGILVKLACGKPRKSEANLENDTEERNAQEGKISEDSKELNIERCQGLNGRV